MNDHRDCCPAKTAARMNGMFEGPVGDDWFHDKTPCEGWPIVKASVISDANIERLNTWLSQVKDGVHYGFILTWMIQIFTLGVIAYWIRNH